MCCCNIYKVSLITKYRRFIKFCIVGLLNTLLDIVIYGVMRQWVGFGVIVSSTITVIIVITFSYVLNAMYVFKSRPNRKSYFKFFITTGIGIVVIQGTISRFIEPILSNFLNLTSASSQIEVFMSNSIVRIGGTAFSLTWNYLFYRYFVFRIVALNKVTVNPELYANQDSADITKSN